MRNGIQESHDVAGFRVCRTKWHTGIARCCRVQSMSYEIGYRNRTMLPGSEYVVRNEMQESHDVAGSVVTKDVPTILRNSCRAWKIKFKNESKESMLHIWNMLC